jgi:hypothetical protein
VKKPLLIRTTEGEELIIDEEHICRVRKLNPNDKNTPVRLEMTDGGVVVCISHRWRQWENDALRRKS